MSKSLEAIFTASSLIRDQWMSTELAVREVLAFERNFGRKHLKLACHAALPLILTPELINLIHINFLDNQQIPWVAEIDFLLSPLCRPIDESLYEVEPSVREVLLVELENQFGWHRLFEISKFLLVYLDRKPDIKQREEIKRCQWWIKSHSLTNGTGTPKKWRGISGRDGFAATDGDGKSFPQRNA